MSNFTDSYALKLVDQITAPLRRIEAHASKLNETMEKLQGLAQSGAGLAKLAAFAGGAVIAYKGLHSAISGVVGLLEAGGKKALAFGEAVIKATAFREKYLAMFGNQLGDKKAGQLYNRVLDVANITPGTSAELMDQVGRFTNIGLRGRGLSKVTAASADIQAMFGDESAAKFGRGITDMFSKAKFEEQDFKQAVSGIIPADKAQAAILRLKGITVAADKVSATFEKLKKQGKISGKEGVAGVLAAIEQNIDKGKGLGSFAVKRGAGSLEGLISNVMEAPENLLRRMNLENMPGIQAIKGFLGRLLEFFDAATPQGRMLADVIERMTNTLFGGLRNISSADLARFFRGGLVVAEKLRALLEGTWKIVDDLIHADGTKLMDGVRDSVLAGGAALGRLVGAPRPDPDELRTLRISPTADVATALLLLLAAGAAVPPAPPAAPQRFGLPPQRERMAGAGDATPPAPTCSPACPKTQTCCAQNTCCAAANTQPAASVPHSGELITPTWTTYMIQ